MPKHVISQPNGKYAVFSTIVNCLIETDLTQGELVQFGYNPEFADSNMNWEQALEEIRDTAFYEHNRDMMREYLYLKNKFR